MDLYRSEVVVFGKVCNFFIFGLITKMERGFIRIHGVSTLFYLYLLFELKGDIANSQGPLSIPRCDTTDNDEVAHNTLNVLSFPKLLTTQQIPNMLPTYRD